MDRTQLERVLLRLALASGFCATLGLWLFTSYSFNQRVASVRAESTALAARYTRGHELLSTATAQLLLSSVSVRDALLNADPTQQRQQVEEMARVVTAALGDYDQLTDSARETDQLKRLRDEFALFHETSIDVIAAAANQPPSDVRELLIQRLVPRRDAALAISEEIQALNRQAFVRQQADIARIHELAERQSQRRLGVALVLGLGTLLVTSLYAVKLESRLRMQLKRDVRLSRELFDTTTALMERDQTRGAGTERGDTPA